MTIYAKIIGTGSYLPPKRITNDELAAILAKQGVETSDEWIRTRSGILARHYADEGVQSSDLGVKAAEKALEMAKCQANDIDMIILATSTPDFFGGFPSTACMVQKNWALPAIVPLSTCRQFAAVSCMHCPSRTVLSAGIYKKVLVVGAETYSRIVDYNDRTTCVLFGDGAGAVVLSASDEPGIMATALHADGNYGDILSLPGKLSNGVVEGKAFVYMDGKAVFKLAVTWMDKVGLEAMGKAGLKNTDIDWMIPHQANLRIMQSSARKLDIPVEKIIVTVRPAW